MAAADYLLEILKIVLPAVLVLIGVAVILSYTEKKQEKRDRYEMKLETLSQIIPLRLQAYERAVLFLERISPENLVIRVNPASKNARQFHAELLADIRSEYEHNMAQQLYITNEGWFELVKAKEQIVSLANSSLNSLPPGAAGGDLGKRIIETLMKAEAAPTHHAILILKSDIQRFFKI